MVVWVSQGIPFATVVPKNLPRKGSVFPGSVQASQPAGRSCLQHCSPCVVPGHTQQWAGVKHTAEDSSEVAATSVTALRLEEGWMWEASWGEAKLKWKRREKEVRKRSRGRWKLSKIQCRSLKDGAHQHNLTTQLNLKEAPETAPGADGSVAFPPAWGLVLVAIFPPRQYDRKKIRVESQRRDFN